MRNLRAVRDVGIGNECCLTLDSRTPSCVIRRRYRRPRERADVGAVAGQCYGQFWLIRKLYRVSLFRPWRHDRVVCLIVILKRSTPTADAYMYRRQDRLRVREEL